MLTGPYFTLANGDVKDVAFVAIAVLLWRREEQGEELLVVGLISDLCPFDAICGERPFEKEASLARSWSQQNQKRV
jgi:hypothetical protein